MYVALTVLAVFLVLVGSELWWQKRAGDDEFSRKFVHITVGSFVAFWPFFLSWEAIKLLSVAFVLAIVVSKYTNVFQAIHSVQRPTWGEIFFGLAVGLVALITQDKWIYCASLLQMSLADGLAAVVGTRFGHSQRYLVFNNVKSVAGTVTFFVVSLVILAVLNPQFPIPFAFSQLVGLSIAASVIENVGVKGFDNLFVPVVVAVFLSRF